jgi:predicted dehydrogenase
MLEGKDPEACARQWAARLGAEYMDDWRQLAARPDVHLVSIMTDPLTAPLVTEYVASLGKPMVRDKYLAADLAGARQALRACEQTGAQMLVTYNVRYLPAVQRLLAELKSGAIGRPLAATFVYLIGNGPLEGFEATAEYLRRVGGGELTCFGPYALDVILEVFATLPERVSASLGAFFYDDYRAVGLEDMAQVALLFPLGRIAHVITGRTTTRPAPDCYFYLEVTGEKGALRTSVPEPRHVCFTRGTQLLPWCEATSVRGMIEDFLARLRTGGSSPIPARRGYEVLQIVKAAYLAAREQRAVTLSEVEAAQL